MGGIKERIEQRRERLLEIGRDLVVEDGLTGLSIEKIAAVEGCSRPTVYLHFRDSNDAFEQIARRSLGLAGNLFQYACSCKGNTRDRVIAQLTCHELMARFHPADFNIVEYLGYPWVQKRFSKALMNTYTEIIKKYMALLTAIIDQAQDDGDLPNVPAGLTSAQFASHLLSMIQGITTTIVKQRLAHQLSQPRDEWEEARRTIVAFLDGVDWHPTINDPEDVSDAYHRLVREVFPQHWVQIETEKLKDQIKSNA